MTTVIEGTVMDDTIASEAQAACADPAAAESFARRIAEEYKDTERALEGKTVAAAYATFAAVQSGWLPAKGDAGEGQISLTDYAALYGKSTATISTWRNAGAAYSLHGLDPQSLVGRQMLQNFGQSAIAKRVLEAKTTKGAVKKASAKAWKDALAEEAARKDAAKAEAKAKRERDAAEAKRKADHAAAEDGDGQPKRNNTGRIDALEATLAAIVWPMSPAEMARFAVFAETVAGLLDRPTSEMVSEEAV